MNVQLERKGQERSGCSSFSRSSALIYGDAVSECLNRAYGTVPDDENPVFKGLLGILDKTSAH